jgi:hypothetical protein
VLSGGYNPTGTITFTLTGPSNTTVYTDVVTVSGNGTYTTATGTNPGGYLPTGIGSYLWHATYSGDSNNNTANDNGQNENETVSQASPTIQTTPVPTSVTLGTSSVNLKDSAVLSSGYNATGTITFTLYNPANVLVDTETVTVNGNGSYTTPTGYTLPVTGTVVGTYQWVASYSGDANNKPANSAKGDEPVPVSKAGPAIQTTATNASGTTTVSDSATLSGGYQPTGTITFRLYGPSASPSCTTLVFTSNPITVAGNGSYGTVSFSPTAVGKYYWIASYSGDNNNTAVAGHCGDTGETSSVNPGVAKVIKKFSGQAPSGTQQVDFELRSGASLSAAGTTLETQTVNAGNGGIVTFAYAMTPGSTYQLCEVLGPLGPGWMTTLGPPLYSVYKPSGDNSTVCTDFVAGAGQTTTFSLNNTPPPGGLGFTIGYWKNWSSCSGGKQAPVLDQTLAKAVTGTSNPPGGLVVSAQLPGLGWPNFAANYYLVLSTTFLKTTASGLCTDAFNLLSKSTMNGKVKQAADPLFNMTAQLLGAELNLFAGAGGNGNIATDVSRAVVLNGKYMFTGNGYTGKLTSADTSLANCLATQLENYNSNRTVGTCP